MILNKNHIRCIELMLRGVEDKLICREFNISLSSLRNWKNDKDFKSEYLTKLNELKSKMYHQMLSLHNKAHQEIETILNSQDTEQKLRVLPLVYSNIWGADKLSSIEEIKYNINTLQEGFDSLINDDEDNAIDEDFKED